MTKKNKLIKTKNTIINKWVQFSNEENLLTTFNNSKIKISFIIQVYVIQWEL